MTRQIFVNLPVQDLQRSIDFFTALGFTCNPQFTDQTAACMVISDEIFAMLLTHPKFQQFTSKAIVDSTQATEVIVALSCASRDEVDQLAERALSAGGTACREPADHGFMYERSFHDPDGHIWELIWIDLAQLATPAAAGGQSESAT